MTALNSELEKPMTYLKGVGPKRAETYEKMGIKTVYDLLCHYPRDYIDLTVTTPVSDAPINEQSVVRCTVVKKLPEARIRKGLSVFKAVVTDGTADLTVVIYNSSFLFASLKLDEEYYLIGKVTGTFIRKEMNSPLIFPGNTAEKLQPVYRLTEGLSQQMLRQTIRNAFDSCRSYIFEPVGSFFPAFVSQHRHTQLQNEQLIKNEPALCELIAVKVLREVDIRHCELL
ncbi:MAG: hypothetical protein II574_06840 [Ruminococcus sp.]|nr:hypothetical protein [Ruminococcus sp.]